MLTYALWVPIRYKLAGIFMFLKEFNSTDMQREPAKVFAAANKEPVIITRQAHEGVVMMSKKEYAKLVSVKPVEKKDAPAKKKLTSTSESIIKQWQIPIGLNPKAWAEFDQHRRKHKSAWTDLAKTKSANILLKLTHDEQQACVDKSCQAGWPGLYPEKIKKEDNRSFLQKQSDATREKLFGSKGNLIEGELDV